MALYIEVESSRVRSGSGRDRRDRVNSFEWHVGEPFPNFIDHQRVTKFQADGDELDMIKRAMRATRAPDPTCSFHDEAIEQPAVWCVSMMVQSEDEEGTHYACAEHLESLMERLLDSGAGQFELNWIGGGRIL